MRRTYTNPVVAGYLTEAAACKVLQKEMFRLIAKYERAVKKEAAAREAEFVEALQFQSELEIQDLYGYDGITAKQFDRYRDLFTRGREALEDLPTTTNACALRILRRIDYEIIEEQGEWEFAALSPEEQRAEQERIDKNNREWKKRLKQLKKERGIIADDPSPEEDEDDEEE